MKEQTKAESLLIVPCGIETFCANLLYPLTNLLIVPCGIETLKVMKPLYEYRIDEMARLLPEDTGLLFAIFIDTCKRDTGHSGSLSVKFQSTNDKNSKSWPSLALKNPTNKEFEIIGNSGNVSEKSIEELKTWVLQNYEKLKEFSENTVSIDKAEIKKALTKYVKPKPNQKPNQKQKIDEGLQFDWKKYKKWFYSNMGISYKNTIVKANLVLLSECPSTLKPVLFVQNNSNLSFEKFDSYERTMVPVSIEREPKILSNGTLPEKVFANVKKLITKNLNLLLGFWKGDEYDDDVYDALKATR